jgi:hypothetical protein
MITIFPNIDTSKYLRPFFSVIFKLLKNHGTLYTIKYLKRVRLHCTRYICGQPLFTNDMSIGIDKEGWPKIFHFLKPLVCRNSTSSLKYLLTLLNFTRSWDLSSKDWSKVKPDYDSITSPSQMKIIIPSGVINKFVKEYKLKSNHPTFDKTKDVYLSCKAGPNGPATVSAMEDLVNFDYPMMDNILKITDENGSDFFCKNYTEAFNNNIRPSKVRTLGKISFVKDPEAKLRLIAISDYFSQLFLKPIHDKIMSLLTHLPCDRTFTQDPHHKWLQNKEQFWSLDLSSATDRFPVELQKRLLARIYDIKLAQSWQSILSKRSFSTPEGGSVKYSTGQPMGTYSSWCVFTLTHHLVVYYCAQLNGLSKFDQYMILGDDIVIKNDAVAKTYINVISRLGVGLSLQKTHVSHDTYEFAKRWIQFQSNREITGLPLGGILRNFNNPNIVFTVLYDYFKIKRNYLEVNHSLVKVINSLYFKIYLIKKKKKFFLLNRKTLNNLYNFSLILDVVFNYYNYDKIRNLFAHNITNENYVLPNEGVALSELKRILSRGLISRITKLNLKLISSPSSLFEKFSHIEDRNLLANNPVFLAIYNTLSKFKHIEFEDLNDLHNISKKICEINIDAIFNKERNKIQSLIEIGKILKDGFKLENKVTDVYYGSATLTDSYTLEGIGRIVQNNISLSEFEQVVNGTYIKDRVWFGSSSYASMWENFKM